VLTTVWWTVGFNFLLYLAALQAIPQDYYEASALDGAGWWRQLRHVTLPMLGRTTVLIVVLQLLASLKVFDQIYLMTQGGPNHVTRPVIQYVYENQLQPATEPVTAPRSPTSSSPSSWCSRCPSYDFSARERSRCDCLGATYFAHRHPDRAPWWLRCSRLCGSSPCCGRRHLGQARGRDHRIPLDWLPTRFTFDAYRQVDSRRPDRTVDAQQGAITAAAVTVLVVLLSSLTA